VGNNRKLAKIIPCFALSFLACVGGVNLFKNLKMDRHRRLNLDDIKFATPQNICEEWMIRKKSCKMLR
jgi:hypothetical protein